MFLDSFFLDAFVWRAGRTKICCKSYRKVHIKVTRKVQNETVHNVPGDVRDDVCLPGLSEQKITRYVRNGECRDECECE